MKLLIGCPVRDRAWVLPKWKECVDRAIPDGVEASFLFLADRGDEETISLLESWGSSVRVIYSDEEFRPYERDWTSDRYHEMVYLRNLLLGEVRSIAPDLFLSLDSDILLHPDALVNMISHLGYADAVGGLTYLNPTDTRVISAGVLRNGRFTRGNVAGDTVSTVNVIMAIKLMSPSAYNVDYRHSTQGEDIGWSIAAQEIKLKLMFDARVLSPHVWSRDWLQVVSDQYDKSIREEKFAS